MGFNDVLKKSFLESFANVDLSASFIIIALFFAGVTGLYIFIVYRITATKTFYSRDFNISVVAIAVITAALILAMQSSAVVSLGMVGALSIVRFRTAVKNPLDLVFLFWAISTGIICGVGLLELDVILSVGVTVIILVLERLPIRRESLLLLVNAQDNVEGGLKSILSRHTKSWQVKSRNWSADGMDMIIELRVKKQAEDKLLEEVKGMDRIVSVSLLAHDGEVTY